jgi:membrane protein
LSPSPIYPAARPPKPFTLWHLWKAVLSLFEQPREELSRVQRLLVDFIRFVIRTPRRMAYNRWLFHASALAYQTLLGLVPALALTLAILSHSAFDNSRSQFIDKIVNVIYPLETSSSLLDKDADRATLEKLNHQGKELVRDSIAKFASNAGKVGGIGFLGLLVAVVLLFRSIENSFNLLWDVRRPRSWGQHTTRTLACLVIFPVAVWFSLLIKDMAGIIPGFTPGSGAFASFVWKTAYPYLCVVTGLMAMYRLAPNIQVRSRPAWGAGILAALVLEICRHIFSYYAVKFLTFSKVYGSLAVVPLVMVWLYFSWAVVLFGAQAAHVLQTIDNPDSDAKRR